MNAVRIKQPIGRPRTRPYALAGDKGYSSKAIRDWLRRHKITAVIPAKSNERKKSGFDRERYRQRNVVERCINWPKEARRLATRYENLAVNFPAMAKLAIIQRCFRVMDSSDRAQFKSVNCAMCARMIADPTCRRYEKPRCNTQASPRMGGGEDSRHGDRFIQEDVLDDVQQLDALFHRPLERLAPGDQAQAAGPFVDDGRARRVAEVVVARRPA